MKIAWASLCLVGMVACRQEETTADAAAGIDAAGPDAGVASDGGSSDGGTADAASADASSADAGEPWDLAHCRNRTCFYIRQNEPGASDALCNGRSPVDLGTSDGNGLRNCPFKSFQSVRLRNEMVPEGGENRRKSFFVGEGVYASFPLSIDLSGTGTSADDGVRLGNFRGEHALISGDDCPASCTVEGASGPITVTPCCNIKCDSCSSDPRCIDLGDGCGVPWDRAYRDVVISGQWTRIEGLEIRGCVSDAVIVAMRTTPDGLSLVPNDHLFLSNNVIHGCDVNENIKGYRNGPGPLQGGPYWGPVQVVGNVLSEMGSQGVDATGVQNWLVEDNYLHDPKPSNACLGTTCDGGGIGFKNGGAQARVRNNWLSRNNGIGMGGVSGSCIDDTSPPSGFGCFQSYEMMQARVENNVVLDAPNGGMAVYQCDDCRFSGNYVHSAGPGALFFVMDDCPGPRCPAHNPTLQATRGLELVLNYLDAGVWQREGPYLFAYHRDVSPAGPVGEGMISRHNTWCAPDGIPEEADPQSDVALFGHTDPAMLYGLTAFAPQLGDVGSRVFNDPAAAIAPCPGPSRCVITPNASGDQLAWQGPADAIDCTLLLDDVETSVPCSGTRALASSERTPGRHYAALRAEQSTGGAACGSSYQIAAPMLGAGCALSIEAGQLSWRASGVSCHLWSDGGEDLGAVPCAGQMPLPSALSTGPRHQVRLAVLDSADGQTSCSVVFTP